MSFLTHLTSQGERWDQIAYRYYGDPLVYGRLIAANPEVAITPILPAGLVLSVPIVEQTAVLEELPPWM